MAPCQVETDPDRYQQRESRKMLSPESTLAKSCHRPTGASRPHRRAALQQHNDQVSPSPPRQQLQFHLPHQTSWDQVPPSPPPPHHRLPRMRAASQALLPCCLRTHDHDASLFSFFSCSSSCCTRSGAHFCASFLVVVCARVAPLPHLHVMCHVWRFDGCICLN